ncbi:hypothetical protein CYMTET_26415, partial [Cymbomonas tetramitiformis]
MQRVQKKTLHRKKLNGLNILRRSSKDQARSSKGSTGDSPELSSEYSEMLAKRRATLDLHQPEADKAVAFRRMRLKKQAEEEALELEQQKATREEREKFEEWRETNLANRERSSLWENSNLKIMETPADKVASAVDEIMQKQKQLREVSDDDEIVEHQKRNRVRPRNMQSAGSSDSDLSNRERFKVVGRVDDSERCEFLAGEYKPDHALERMCKPSSLPNPLSLPSNPLVSPILLSWQADWMAGSSGGGGLYDGRGSATGDYQDGDPFDSKIGRSHSPSSQWATGNGGLSSWQTSTPPSPSPSKAGHAVTHQ